MHSDKPNLASALVRHLREQISGGAIPPGQKLPSENELIAEHGVSRTVVREAITRLQAEGLVYTRRGAGSFALTPPPAAEPSQPAAPRTVAERRQLLEFRTGFESEAAALAAANHQPADLKRLDAALHAFEQATGHAAQSMQCDYEFHLAIAQASANPYFSHAVQGFGPAMISMPRQRIESSADSQGGSLDAVSAEHRGIRDAIAAGNPMAAAAAMRVHLGNSLRRLAFEAGA
ncbi:FadR/GntR family transcriptional regulator [Glutamicibacter sp. 0426]|uniref:FadR/GntR family transcriptional regulator n=1 Tax=Glutamicibacter sp. 0426 TaxID=1913445 RepID=UPI00093B8443|nr:FadR/GntR family transcriptional regulator [Glutamicibacter sp. 0426]